MRSAKQTTNNEGLALISTVIVTLIVPALGLLSACDKEPPRAPAPPAQPAKASPPAATLPPASDAAPPAKTKMVANPDGLSLADRIAKRQAAEAKVAAELAAAEKERLLKYDRGKLVLHQQVFAFILKIRAQYDSLEKKGGGEKGKADLDKLRDTLQQPIAATAKKMATIDPKGGNSNVTTDYDVMLNALANDYPAAIASSYGGDGAPLVDQKAEMDKRSKKVVDWLAALKTAKK